MSQATKNSKEVNATPADVYRAFMDPAARELFLAPGEMTAKVHAFDHRVGGGYEMSLYYPEGEKQGKTTPKEDRFTAKFLEIIPNKKIVEAVRFQSTDPDFAEVMTMEVTFESTASGTLVTFLFENIPTGIKPEDNEAGTMATLEKLAAYFRERRKTS